MGNNETTIALDKYKGFKMLWYKLLIYAVLPIVILACLLGAVAHVLTLLQGLGTVNLEAVLALLEKIKFANSAVYTNYLPGAGLLDSYMVADIIAAVLLVLCAVLLFVARNNFAALKKGTALFMSGVLLVIPVALFIYESSIVLTSNGSVTFGLWSMICLVALIPFIALNSLYFKKRETVFIN